MLRLGSMIIQYFLSYNNLSRTHLFKSLPECVTESRINVYTYLHRKQKKALEGKIKRKEENENTRSIFPVCLRQKAPHPYLRQIKLNSSVR